MIKPRFRTAVLGRQQGEGRVRSFCEPARHEAPFRRKSAGKRHPSPSRIAPKALPARCFSSLFGSGNTFASRRSALSMFKRKPSPEGKLA
jgi:hypothetical protein